MVQNFNIIKSILSEPWFISEEEAMKLSYLLTPIFNNKVSFEPISREDMARVAYVVEDTQGDSSTVSNIGVINITGAMYKYDSMCDYGMESYGKMLRDFYADTSVSEIILKIDSPGSTVIGTEELGNIIKESPKPITAFISDYACSGAYWIASCCHEIVANNSTATIGSIGVMTSITDMSALYEKQGIKITNIYAPQSPNKHQESKDIKEGNFDGIKSQLSVLAEKFHSVVRSNRPSVQDDQLTGKVYFAQDVVGTLIDRIASWEDMITSLTKKDNIIQNNYMAKSNLTALAAAAQVDAFETLDGSITLTDEQALNVNTQLNEAALASVRITELESAAEAAEAREAALSTTNANLTSRITELETKPGAEHAEVNPSADGQGSPTPTITSFAEGYASALEFINSNN